MQGLADWSSMDSWIVVTAALAAIGCALPGTLLLLRRQSLLGDALSHAMLPGLVMAYLGINWLEHTGWISASAAQSWRPAALLLGAGVTAVLSASLSEVLARRAHLDPGASLGVVYTAMFAGGLLLLRIAADSAHIDTSCVLYGNLESTVLDTVGRTGVPRAVWINGGIVLINTLLLVLFYKELLLCTFDPGLARSLGLPVATIQQVLLVCTGATIVAAFESVGSILVIAMLVVPAASSVLLSDRLPRALAWAAALGALSALLGHVGALTAPVMIRQLLQWPELGDISTAGMMTVAAGLLFVMCWLFSPRHGLVREWADQRRLQRRILAEDILGALYRLEELTVDRGGRHCSVATLSQALRLPERKVARGIRRLELKGDLQIQAGELKLTDLGRLHAQNLVRSHRLWESYLAQHFQLESPRLHASAEQIEHYLDPDLREKLATELSEPGHDPHGASIPPAGRVSDAAP